MSGGMEAAFHASLASQKYQVRIYANLDFHIPRVIKQTSHYNLFELMSDRRAMSLFSRSCYLCPILDILVIK